MWNSRKIKRMAENQNTNNSSSRDSSGHDADKKKKLVIKKTGITQNKDISDVFRDSSKPAPAKPAPSKEQRPAPAAQSGTNQDRPRQSRQEPVRHTPRTQASPIVSRAPRNEPGQRPQGSPQQGGRPGDSSSRGPGDQNRRPPGTGYQGQRPAGGGPAGAGRGRPGNDFSGASTPFDRVVESGRRPAGGGSGPQGAGGRGPSRSGGGPNRKPGDAPVVPLVDGAAARSSRGGGRPSGGKEHTSRKGDTDDHFLVKLERKKNRPQSGTTVPKQIEIMGTLQVGELAKKLNLKPSEVIGKLMKMGEMVTITQAIDSDTASLLAAEYGCEVKVISLYEETIIQAEADIETERTNRPPVVTIMGHVDHGKTKLLDTIRKTNVVATEAGAITQHIGAYQVTTSGGKITFLDTPGHEAFTAMRARGAKVTDIVVLVVAADDGVKEQTVEALTHAKEAGVPIIVAVNKIDLPTANKEKVMQELVGHGLQPEDWGGSTIFCEISAKENIGIQNLLDMILIQAEVLDLKANAEIRAVGHVIEAKIDPGKGPVATILVEKGTLREGDPYVAGIFSGRVRAMFDDLGRKVQEAGPSTPVEITGIDGVPEAGDPFQVVESERYGREIAGKRHYFKQITDAANRQPPSLKDLHNWLQVHKELKVIIKADVQGSVEAIKDGLIKLSTDEVKVRVIHGATGAISESDVSLASASDALIIGFQVRATPKALELAGQSRVDIKYYSIIYKVIEDIQVSMEGLLEPEKIEEILGSAEVRAIFKISKVGNIAGCMVKSGTINRKSRIRIIRNNVVIHTCGIKSLKREKDDASEVREGFECGILLDGFNDFVEGDTLECFEVKEVARKLGG